MQPCLDYLWADSSRKGSIVPCFKRTRTAVWQLWLPEQRGRTAALPEGASMFIHNTRLKKWDFQPRWSKVGVTKSKLLRHTHNRRETNGTGKPASKIPLTWLTQAATWLLNLLIAFLRVHWYREWRHQRLQPWARPLSFRTLYGTTSWCTWTCPLFWPNWWAWALKGESFSRAWIVPSLTLSYELMDYFRSSDGQSLPVKLNLFHS